MRKETCGRERNEGRNICDGQMRRQRIASNQERGSGIEIEGKEE
jgi:hypothetical protein